jgi:hypothetical protein
VDHDANADVPGCNSAQFMADLRREVRDEQVAFVVGAGISRAASGDDVALWRGLLRNGIQRCADNDRSLGEGFIRRQNALIDGTMKEMLATGDVLVETLEEQRDFGSWLKQSVGALEIRDATLLKTIARFNALITTTNYDTLLEAAIPCEGISMEDSSALGVLRGDRKAVLHFHGLWHRRRRSFSETVRTASCSQTKDASRVSRFWRS